MKALKTLVIQYFFIRLILSQLYLQNRTEQNRAEQSRAKQKRTEQNRTERFKTRQDKTRQDKTRQDKTRQDKSKTIDRPTPLKMLSKSISNTSLHWPSERGIHPTTTATVPGHHHKWEKANVLNLHVLVAYLVPPLWPCLSVFNSFIPLQSFDHKTVETWLQLQDFGLAVLFKILHVSIWYPDLFKTVEMSSSHVILLPCNSEFPQLYNWWYVNLLTTFIVENILIAIIICRYELVKLRELQKVRFFTAIIGVQPSRQLFFSLW